LRPKLDAVAGRILNGQGKRCAACEIPDILPTRIPFPQHENAMTSPALEFDLRAAIRTIPDYPKPGIMFRDITTLLGNARAFRRAVDELVQPWAGMKIDKVAGMQT